MEFCWTPQRQVFSLRESYDTIDNINNIGIKLDFLCINIYRAPREMLKPEPERRGFQPLPRGLVDVNVSEKHVLSLFLHRVMI